MMLVLLALLNSAALVASNGLTKDSRLALKAFEEMKPIYFESGLSTMDVELRKDIFIANFLRFSKMGRIKGRTFNTKLNSIELLTDKELEAMFGLIPEFPHPDEPKPAAPVLMTPQELEQSFGEEMVLEATLVFMALRPQFKEHQITQKNMDAQFEDFIKAYTQMPGIEEMTVEERANSALKLLEEVVENLLGDKIEKNISSFEVFDDVVPNNLRPKRSLSENITRLEKFQDASYIGPVLTPDQYSQAALTTCSDLAGTKQVDKSCLKSPCEGTTLNRRCMKNKEGIPDEFNDWEDEGYVGSLLAYRAATTMPGGWAHAATQVMDMYQQIFAKNQTQFRKDNTDLIHMLNCVYKTSGLARGSPQAAFQYMSDKVVIPKFGDSVGIDCRDPELACSNTYSTNYTRKTLMTTDNIFYKFFYIWYATKKSRDNEFCTESATFNPANAATPNVTFLPGKAYKQFADTKPGSAYVDMGNGVHVKTQVYGEHVAKPLIYEKGPLAIMMQACYEIFYVTDGIFNYDCSSSSYKYLPQWVIVLSYGPSWFGTVMPKLGSSKVSYVQYADVTKVSRQMQYMFDWNTFVVPRVAPYTNVEECQNGGISTSEGKCYCDTAYYGPRCQLECPLVCKNGGQLSHTSCKCDCPNTHYGRACRKVCECGLHGKCDEEGNCICNRQSVWGPKCAERCLCKNAGYCHKDGTCECMAGFAGTTCEDLCTESCDLPKTCRYSTQPINGTHFMGLTSCDCPRGFYGKKCETSIQCGSKDLLGYKACKKLQNRSRCYTEEAMLNCPQQCGHCLWLNQEKDTDL